MAYLSNIPQANDQLSVSQGNILGNFTALGAIAGNGNPASGSLNATAGFNWLYLPAQLAAPPAGALFPAGDIGLYSFLNAVTTKNELYVNKTNQATVVQIPMTASTLSTTSAPASNAGMWTYLPSGLLLKSGSNAGVLSGLVTVTPTGGPAFTQILSVIVCPYNPTTTGDLNFSVRLVDINSATTFRVYLSSRTNVGASAGATGFQFLAIGY
jgi:hypothetical protein